MYLDGEEANLLCFSFCNFALIRISLKEIHHLLVEIHDIFLDSRPERVFLFVFIVCAYIVCSSRVYTRLPDT